MIQGWFYCDVQAKAFLTRFLVKFHTVMGDLTHRIIELVLIGKDL